MDRYWQILARRPTRGTALDLLVREHLDAGRLEELSAQAKRRRDAAPDDAAAHLLHGLICERRGRLDAAAQSYAAARRLAPRDYYAARLAGELAARQMKLDAAAQALTESLELSPPPSERLEIGKLLGRLQLRRGNAAEALAAWRRLADAFPDDVRVVEELAEVAVEERQFDEAWRHWQQVEKLAQGDLNKRLMAQIERGQVRLLQGNTTEAVAIWSQALDRVQPESWLARDIRRRIESAYLRGGDSEGLLEYYERRISERPDDLDTQLALAEAHRKAGKRGAAIEQLQAAVAVAPDRRDVRAALIEALVREGRSAEAIAQCDTLLERHPRDAESLRLAGQIHLEAADPQERAAAEAKAAQIWRRIAETRPNDPALALQAADLCAAAAPRKSALSGVVAALQLDEPPAEEDSSPSPLLTAAEDLLGEAVRRSGGRADCVEQWARFLIAQDRRDEASQALAQMTQGEHDRVENWRRLAEAAASLGMRDLACEAADALVQRAPRDFTAHELRINLLVAAGKAGAAVAHLDHLDRLADDAALQEKAVQRRIETVAAAGQLDEAVERLRQAAQEGAATTIERWTLAAMLLSRSQPIEAVRALQGEADKSDAPARLVRLYAETLEGAGLAREAAAQWRRLAQLAPQTQVECFQHLVSLELKLNEGDRARQAAAELVQSAPLSPAAHRLKGEVELKLGDRQAAAAALRQAVRLAPDDLETRLQLAQLLRALEQADEAWEHAWRCFELAARHGALADITSVLCDLAKSPADQDRLIEELRRRRRLDRDSREVTLCLAQALRKFQRNDQAREQLERLLAERPRDETALEAIISLAADGKDWKSAARFAERLAAVAPTRERFERLANFYRQSGERDREEQLWRELLDRLDAEGAAALIDLRLGTGKFEDAAKLAQAALARHPHDWRLHQRAGAAQLQRRMLKFAAEHFEAVLAALPAPPLAADAAPSPLKQLEDAANLAASIKSAAGAQARTGRIQVLPAGSIQVSPAAVPWTTSAADQAGLVAVMALFHIAQQERRSSALVDAWLQERGENAGEVRRLLIAAAALGAEELPRLLDAAQRRQPDDPLPHVVRAQLPQGYLPQLIQAGKPARDQWLAEARKSFAWLGEHAPHLRREAIAGYCEQLSALGEVDEAAEIMAPAIAEAETVDDLSRLVWLANSFNNGPLVRRTLQRAAELAPALQSSPQWGALAHDLVFLSVSGRFAVVEDERTAAQLVEVGIAAIDALSSSSSAVRGSAIRGQSIPPYTQVLTAEISQLQQQILHLRSQSPNSAAVQPLMRRLQSLMAVYQGAMRSQAPSYGVVIGPQAMVRERGFPFVESMGLQHAETLLVQTLVEGLRTQEHRELLVKRLEERAKDGPSQANRLAVFAKTYSLWTDKKYDEAIAEFKGQVEASPDDATLRLALARAYDIDGNLPAVWETIKPLLDQSTPEAVQARSLRERILRE